MSCENYEFGWNCNVFRLTIHKVAETISADLLAPLRLQVLLISLMELLTGDVLSEFQDLLKKMVTDISKIDDHHQTVIHIQSLMSLSELLFLTKLVRSPGLPSREPNFIDTLRWIKTDPRSPQTQHCPGTYNDLS